MASEAAHIAYLESWFGVSFDQPSDASGAYGAVHFGQRDGERVVVKLLRDKDRGRHHSWHEAMMLDELDSAACEPPLHVPQFIETDTDDDGTGFVVSTYVEGDVVTADQLNRYYQLDPVAQQELGTKIGSFVAWLAQTITPGKFFELVGDEPLLFADRTERLYRLSMNADFLQQMGVPRLAGIVEDLTQEHLAYFPDGVEPRPIIGHSDLRPNNLTFTTSGSVDQPCYVPVGVIDFGATQPSSPERELRHLAALGLGEAVKSAATAYHEQTGSEVDLELINFWARVQTATILGWSAALGIRLETGTTHVLEMMRTWYPDLPMNELRCLPGAFFLQQAGMILNRNGKPESLEVPAESRPV
ncbi:MAG TPA: phosphotransferase [Verrucomicrobiae bacterium]|nr:phosphotransferase [Verrucomicrobiae bacterium]